MSIFVCIVLSEVLNFSLRDTGTSWFLTPLLNNWHEYVFLFFLEDLNHSQVNLHHVPPHLPHHSVPVVDCEAEYVMK